MIDNSIISKTKDRIQNVVLAKVSTGRQNDDLDSNTYVSCGQFLDTSNTQRGLHGSVAAISVLVDRHSNENNLVLPKLAAYVRDYKQIELKIGQKNTEKVELGSKNIIKISEIIIEFRKIPRGNIKAAQYKDNLISILRNCHINFSWPYFCGETNFDIVPTSFAALALKSYGDSSLLDNVIPNLRNYLQSQTNSIDRDPNLFAKYVLVTYVFSKIKKEDNSTDTTLVKNCIKRFKKSPFYNMRAHVEQMIQYRFQSDHHYLRIPWQLYAIELLAKNDIWGFSTIQVQERLSTLCETINTAQFYYPSFHSEASSRTYSIVYKMLNNISIKLSQSILIVTMNWIGIFRKFLGNIAIKYILSILAFIFIAFSIYQWYEDPNSNISDLAPEFMGSMFLALLALRTIE